MCFLQGRRPCCSRFKEKETEVQRRRQIWQFTEVKKLVGRSWDYSGMKKRGLHLSRGAFRSPLETLRPISIRGSLQSGGGPAPPRPASAPPRPVSHLPVCIFSQRGEGSDGQRAGERNQGLQRKTGAAPPPAHRPKPGAQADATGPNTHRPTGQTGTAFLPAPAPSRSLQQPGGLLPAPLRAGHRLLPGGCLFIPMTSAAV